jgi:aryl-alcohol dehydrogenase-like predicted oxidoreductase
MQKRSLGKTGIMVSEIAFGGVEIGLPYGVHKELMPQDAAINLLKAAVDSGINFFDTARMYGCSEERMGMAFKGMRDKLVVSSKCPHLRLADGTIRSMMALSPFVEESLHTSLKMLGTDYLDVYLIHGADAEIMKIDEVGDVFETIKRKGYVRAIGVSTYGFADFKLACEDGRWDVVQLAFNLMDQTAADMFPVARQTGIGIVVRSVLMRGILTDVGVDLTHGKLYPVAEHRKKYLELLKDKNDSLSDLATKFVLSFADVSSVLVGIDKMEFLEKAVALANGTYLDDAILAQIKQLAYPDPDFLNLAIWDRNGWTK